VLSDPDGVWALFVDDEEDVLCRLGVGSGRVQDAPGGEDGGG